MTSVNTTAAETSIGSKPIRPGVVGPRGAQRLHAVVLGATFGLLLLSGVLLRVGAVQPRNLLDRTTYNHIFSFHGVLTLASLPVVLICLAPAAKPDFRLRAALAALFVIGAGLSRLGSGGLVLMLAGAAVFGWFFIRPHLRSASGVVLFLATSATVFGWAGVLAGRPASMGMAMTPLVVAAIILPVFGLRSAGKKVAGGLFVPSVLVYAVCWAMARFWVAAAPLAIPELLGGLVVGIAVFRSARLEKTLWLTWVGRAESLLFIEGLVLVVLMQIIGSGAPLDDTFFAVAAAHFEAFVLLFALLRWLRPGSQTRLGWTGLVTATIGAHVFGWSCTILGARGMPRRYADHLEIFNSLHAVASVGAFLFFMGTLAIVGAYALGASERPRDAKGI
jgi:hypothetical protein